MSNTSPPGIVTTTSTNAPKNKRNNQHPPKGVELFRESFIAYIRGLRETSPQLQEEVQKYEVLARHFTVKDLIQASVKFQFDCSEFVILVPSWHKLREELFCHIKTIGVKVAKRSVSTKQDLILLCIRPQIKFDFSDFAKANDSHGNCKRLKKNTSGSGIVPLPPSLPSDPLPLLDSFRQPSRSAFTPSPTNTSAHDPSVTRQLGRNGSTSANGLATCGFSGPVPGQSKVEHLAQLVMNLESTDLHRFTNWLSAYIYRIATLRASQVPGGAPLLPFAPSESDQAPQLPSNSPVPVPRNPDGRSTVDHSVGAGASLGTSPQLSTSSISTAGPSANGPIRLPPLPSSPINDDNIAHLATAAIALSKASTAAATSHTDRMSRTESPQAQYQSALGTTSRANIPDFISQSISQSVSQSISQVQQSAASASLPLLSSSSLSSSSSSSSSDGSGKSSSQSAQIRKLNEPLVSSLLRSKSSSSPPIPNGSLAHVVAAAASASSPLGPGLAPFSTTSSAFEKVSSSSSSSSSSSTNLNASSVTTIPLMNGAGNSGLNGNGVNGTSNANRLNGHQNGQVNALNALALANPFALGLAINGLGANSRNVSANSQNGSLGQVKIEENGHGLQGFPNFGQIHRQSLAQLSAVLNGTSNVAGATVGPATVSPPTSGTTSNGSLNPTVAGIATLLTAAPNPSINSLTIPINPTVAAGMNLAPPPPPLSGLSPQGALVPFASNGSPFVVVNPVPGTGNIISSEEKTKTMSTAIPVVTVAGNGAGGISSSTENSAEVSSALVGPSAQSSSSSQSEQLSPANGTSMHQSGVLAQPSVLGPVTGSTKTDSTQEIRLPSTTPLSVQSPAAVSPLSLLEAWSMSAATTDASRHLFIPPWLGSLAPSPGSISFGNFSFLPSPATVAVLVPGGSSSNAALSVPAPTAPVPNSALATNSAPSQAHSAVSEPESSPLPSNQPSDLVTKPSDQEVSVAQPTVSTGSMAPTAPENLGAVTAEPPSTSAELVPEAVSVSAMPPLPEEEPQSC